MLTVLRVILKYLGIVRKDMLSAAIAADWDDEQDSLEVEVLIEDRLTVDV